MKPTQELKHAPTLTKLHQIRTAPTTPDLKRVRDAREVARAKSEGRYIFVSECK